MALKLIRKQVLDVENTRQLYESQGCPINVEVVGDNFFQLKAEIGGPPGTPYEGGTFKMDITVPSDYPFRPPRIHFVTKIWHPNINDLIFGSEWAAQITLTTLLITIQAMLSTPRIDCPQNSAAYKQFTEHPDLFERTAKHWTNIYAGGPNRQPELEEKCTKLMAMGFEEDRARLTLSSENWNVEQAVAKLLRN